MSVIAGAVRYPRQRKRLSIAVIAAAAVIGCAGEARAATNVRVAGGLLSVSAGAGRANQITVFDAAANVRVRDLADVVVPGPGCVFVDSHTADCPRVGISRARAIARDMDDRVLTFSSVPIFLYGHDGADTLVGGSGDDYLDGGSGPDVLFGAAGADHTSYAANLAGVTVSLDGVANDGVSSEGDNVSPTIENITGSGFDDLIFGSPSPNLIDGGRGNDRVWGFDGADTFRTSGPDGADEYNGGAGVDHVSYTQRPQRVIVQLDGAPNDGDPVAAEGDNVRLDIEQVTGGSNDDVLLGNNFDNRLDGARGNDLLDGRGGADTLIGGFDNDRLFGGFGNDVLDGADGAAGNDTLDGQADIDTCTSDAGDVETACEL